MEDKKSDITTKRQLRHVKNYIGKAINLLDKFEAKKPDSFDLITEWPKTEADNYNNYLFIIKLIFNVKRLKDPHYDASIDCREELNNYLSSLPLERDMYETKITKDETKWRTNLERLSTILDQAILTKNHIPPATFESYREWIKSPNNVLILSHL